MNRRTLGKGVFGLALLGFARCTSQQIAVAEQDIQDVEGVASAIDQAIVAAGGAIPADVEATINGLLDDAQKLVEGLAPGAFVVPNSVANILSDLSTALKDFTTAFGSNAYIVSAQVVLAALSTAWNAGSAGVQVAQAQTVVTDAPAAQVPTLANARALLKVLPHRPKGGTIHYKKGESPNGLLWRKQAAGQK